MITLQDIKFPLSGEYRTGSKYEPYQFYTDALMNSQSLDLLLGYFSSSAISLLSYGFARFLHNGGTVRLVINHILSEQDKNILEEAESEYLTDYSNHLRNFDLLQVTLDQYGVHFFECLAWLIKQKRIQIVIIKPKNNRGIAHYKSGLFRDRTNTVKFKASCNFTSFGLAENLEELEIKRSWISEVENASISDYQDYYEEIFYKKADFVEYVEDFKEIEVAILSEFGDKTIEELLVTEQKLQEQKKRLNKNKQLQKVEVLDFEDDTPRFPYASGARGYQIEAYQNWLENGKKGVFAMATGTGKTITALNCVLEEYQKSNTFHVLITVPTNVLVGQWEENVRKFNFSNIVKVSSKFPKWQNELDILLTNLEFGLEESFVVIITYASFSKSRFQSFFRRFPTDAVLIADEAHNIASPSIKVHLDHCFIQNRIGLSATPKRIYDPLGTSAMEQFFADKSPYTYDFTLKRAIEEGILCQYYYYPKIIELTTEEQKDYNDITKQIVRLHSAKNKKEKQQKIETLLMARKRIIHKAANKLIEFERIIREMKRKFGQLNHSLIYAPEGFFEERLTTDDDLSIPTEEETRIINHYSSIVRQVSPETTINAYTSNTENKDSLLTAFEENRLNVLISMKCLDEGVDIPRTQNAIFCSSTGNPRQFIQRRGRILRSHQDKDFAHIYDLVVIPNTNAEGNTFRLERSLVQKELERVVHFAYMAINKYQATKPFETVCNKYDLSLDTIHLELEI